MLHFLGHATKNTASVVVRNDANATATLVCNGETQQKSIDTAVMDGFVRFDFSGLAQATRYPYTVALSTGEVEHGTLKTQKPTGNCVGHFSCNNLRLGMLHATGLYDLDALVNIGDLLYPEGVGNIASYADAIDRPTWIRMFMEKPFAAPDILYALKHAPFYYSPDDHDLAINDLRWLSTKFDDALTGGPFDETMMRAVMDVGGSVIQSIAIGNPGNTDSGVDTNPFYFRFYVGDHIEVFVLCCVMWGYDTSSPTRLVRPDFGQPLMLGAKQDAWIRNALATSTRPFKIILSNKMTHYAEWTNNDGWKSYFDDLDDGAGNGLLHFIHAADGWTSPGGVIWGSGDYHTPSVHECRVDKGADYDHVNVTACPSGMDQYGIRDSGVGGTYTTQYVNTGQGDAGLAEVEHGGKYAYLRNFGIFQLADDASYLEPKIIICTGHEWYSGSRLYAGENKLTYRRPKVT